MKIMMTGFEPFGGESMNPALEAVRRLPDRVAGAEIVKVELPTVYGRAGEVLEEAVRRELPDAVLCVGQAGGRSGILVERVAINLRDTKAPDNGGRQPVDEAVREDGPAAYFSSVPVKRMVAAIREAGIPAFLSYSAGTFVCNDILYSLLHLAARDYPAMKGGIHPCALRHGADGGQALRHAGDGAGDHCQGAGEGDWGGCGSDS